MTKFINWFSGTYLLCIILTFILNLLINRLVLFVVLRRKKQELFELTMECKRLEYRVEKLKTDLKKEENSRKE